MQHNPTGEANGAWLEARVGIVTGSKCAGLAGLNPYTSVERAVKDMVWPGKFVGNRMTQWGNDNEDMAEKALRNLLDPLRWGTKQEDDAETALCAVLDHLGNGDYKIDHPGLVLSPHDGWTGVSDGVLTAPNGTRVLLEYKCLVAAARAQPGIDGGPLPHLQAVRRAGPDPVHVPDPVGMRILRCTTSYFVIWAPDPYPVEQTARVDKGHSKIYRTPNGVVQVCCVRYDEEFCAELLEKCGRAWRERFVPAHVMRQHGMLRHGQLEPELII